MLSFCIGISRKTLKSLQRPPSADHAHCFMGVCSLPAFQTGQGPVVPFPHGTSSSMRWWQGPGRFDTQANWTSLHSHLPFPSSYTLQGLSLEFQFFTGGSHHQGQAAWHPLTEKNCLKTKTNIPQQNLFPWMHYCEKVFNKSCLVFWQHADPFLSVFPKEIGKKHLEFYFL